MTSPWLAEPDVIDREEIIRQLYAFIIHELDPEPCPIAEYLGNAHLGAVADAIVGPDAQPEPWTDDV